MDHFFVYSPALRLPMSNVRNQPPHWVAILLTCLLCLDCSAQPPRDPKATSSNVPTHWHTRLPADGIPEIAWLRGFADDTLARLVKHVLSANYDLMAAAARVQAAREQVRIDGASRWPNLSFTPGYQRAQMCDSGFGSSQFGAFEAMFSLDWALDVWGRLRDFRYASSKEVQATAADLQGARLSLAARVAQGYFDLAEARLIEILTLLDSYRSTLNAQSAHLAVKRQLLNNRIALYIALGGAV